MNAHERRVWARARVRRMSDAELHLHLNCALDHKGQALQRAARAEWRRRNPAAVAHAYEVVTIAGRVGHFWRVETEPQPRRRRILAEDGG